MKAKTFETGDLVNVFFIMIFVVVVLGICPYPHKIVVKKISDGKILAKDVKSGTDKIFTYNVNDADFNYVAKGDTLKHTVPLISLEAYKRSRIVDFGNMVLNSDSLYVRKQRELFNQQLQQMSENQK